MGLNRCESLKTRPACPQPSRPHHGSPAATTLVRTLLEQARVCGGTCGREQLKRWLHLHRREGGKNGGRTWELAAVEGLLWRHLKGIRDEPVYALVVLSAGHAGLCLLLQLSVLCSCPSSLWRFVNGFCVVYHPAKEAGCSRKGPSN